jgi:iron transport multicopper oxidase
MTSNAAGNNKSFLDLSGQNMQLGWLLTGFTARGIITLVFLCLSTILGIGFIIMYGLSDLKFKLASNMTVAAPTIVLGASTEE